MTGAEARGVALRAAVDAVGDEYKDKPTAWRDDAIMQLAHRFEQYILLTGEAA